jgi:hypothetical protein
MTNPQTHSEQAVTPVHQAEVSLNEGEALASLGFNDDEVISLLWLRQWYQHGGSDRVEVVRRLEFVKQLVMHGTIEL